MPAMSSKDMLELLDGRDAALGKRVLLSSGLALLLAGAFRLPSWEIASPVAWLVGSVNVGFLPIFGPILVLGTFAFTYIQLREYLGLRTAVLSLVRDQDGGPPDPLLAAAFPEVRPEATPADPALKTALVVQQLWIFLVPLVAYAILLASYLDFVRPKCGDPNRAECLAWTYPSRTGQVADLFLGIGGWGGFQPQTPSIQTALRERADAAGEEADATERQRLVQLARFIPWIYPPLQTWAYVLGFGLQLWLSVCGWREFGATPRVRLRP